jgi:ribosomal protein S18 acetylase RimI-like enzyme
MEKQILNSTIEDIDSIFKLYTEAIEFQKTVFHRAWVRFERSLVETEIKELRQWKIVVNGEIACIFALTFSDALLWKEKDAQPAIYIHRIVTNPKFRGGFYVKDIVIWAKTYCKMHQKDFIRLDTWGDNPKLIDYYCKCGFDFLEIISLNGANTVGLPVHYKGTLALFEMAVVHETRNK